MCSRMKLLYLGISILFAVGPSAGTHEHVTCTSGNLRLTNTSYGTLQIYKNHEWRLVCSSGWGHVDAAVACKQLGYDGGYINYTRLSITGTVDPIKYNCNGSETNLQNCLHEDDLHCSSYSQVKIGCVHKNTSDPCKSGDIRLWGGQTEHEGNIELCNDHGVWSAVCDYSWSHADAVVACRQLQKTNTTIALPYYNSEFGRRLQPMEFGGLTCSGSEASLQQCSLSSSYARYSDYYHCGYDDHAGVKCIPKAMASCSNGDVRLVDGYARNNGYAEICIDDQWIGACQEPYEYRRQRSMMFSRICSELGYPRYTSINGAILQTNRNEPPAYVLLSDYAKSCDSSFDCIESDPTYGFTYLASCTLPYTILCCPNDSCSLYPMPAQDPTLSTLPEVGSCGSQEPVTPIPPLPGSQEPEIPTPPLPAADEYNRTDEYNKSGDFVFQFGAAATSFVISGSGGDLRGLKEDITSRIVDNISSKCNCAFDASSLQDGVLAFGETMSYRSKVLEVDGQAPARLLAILKESIEEEPQIPYHCNHIHISLEVSKFEF